jgi:hypothetical protein
MTALYAGTAVRTITPDLGTGHVYLAGFKASGPTTGVHRDLRVRALIPRADEAWLALLADLQRQEGPQ